MRRRGLQLFPMPKVGNSHLLSRMLSSLRAGGNLHKIAACTVVRISHYIFDFERAQTWHNT